MPAPTAPVDINVTLNQQEVDALWTVIEEDFPDLTGPEITDRLRKWSKDGILAGVRRAIANRARNLAAQASLDFENEWTPLSPDDE